MIEHETRLKVWGNSIGVIIPKEDIKKEGLHVDQKVKVVITPVKTLKVKDIFGKLKLKLNTKELLKEVDEELDSKFF
ncbi:hypothetical protein HYX08_00915 [Candidatus Woesearchaeota archaeon]|nr:hypothetical protein [Candidatus Woesearchaeota archaeon]